MLDGQNNFNPESTLGSQTNTKVIKDVQKCMNKRNFDKRS